MKAAVVVANEDVQYQEIEEPKVTKGAVKIRVRYSGICGSDIPRVLNNGVHFYPIVLGHEFSGDVVEVGEGVTKVKVGDRVSGAPLLPCMKCDDCQQGNFSLCKHYSFIGSRQQGSNADYVVVPEQNAVPFDKSVSYEQGAMFEPATVAIHGVFQNDYHGGEYVAILGGGTVGMFTMQWTKIFGSKKVVVFDISDERLDLAKRLGADEVINTKKEGYMEKAMAITRIRRRKLRLDVFPRFTYCKPPVSAPRCRADSGTAGNSPARTPQQTRPAPQSPPDPLSPPWSGERAYPAA